MNERGKNMGSCMSRPDYVQNKYDKNSANSIIKRDGYVYLGNVSLRKLNKEEKLAKHDIEFEWSDNIKKYDMGDEVNLDCLKKHLDEGYRKNNEKYIALMVLYDKIKAHQTKKALDTFEDYFKRNDNVIFLNNK